MFDLNRNYFMPAMNIWIFTILIGGVCEVFALAMFDSNGAGSGGFPVFFLILISAFFASLISLIPHVFLMFLVFQKTKTKISRYLLISLVCLFDILLPLLIFGDFVIGNMFSEMFPMIVASYVVGSQIAIALASTLDKQRQIRESFNQLDK